MQTYINEIRVFERITKFVFRKHYSSSLASERWESEVEGGEMDRKWEKEARQHWTEMVAIEEFVSQ